MGKQKHTETGMTWNAYMTNNAISPYHPQQYGQHACYIGPPTHAQYMAHAMQKQGATDAEKLDQVTRSRNALIITLIVFVALFFACFIAVFVVAFPPEESNTFPIDVTGTKDDLTFDATMNTNAATGGVVEASMCTALTNAAKGASTVISCGKKSGTVYASGTGGKVLATMTLVVEMDDKTIAERFALVKAAVEANPGPSYTITTVALG